MARWSCAPLHVVQLQLQRIYSLCLTKLLLMGVFRPLLPLIIRSAARIPELALALHHEVMPSADFL